MNLIWKKKEKSLADPTWEKKEKIFEPCIRVLWVLLLLSTQSTVHICLLFAYLMLACHYCLSRNAQASSRTRHAQLLLPVSWRSGADHTPAGMVSHKRIGESVHSCWLSPTIFTPYGSRLCTSFVCRVEQCWPAAASTGRSASGCFCCGFNHTAPLCAQHMSNTSPHTCPCMAIWLLNLPQSSLEALLCLWLASCLLSTFFVFFYSYFFSIFLLPPSQRPRYSLFLFFLH